MNPLTIEWIEKAEQDYRVAIRESRVKKSPAYGAICFHAQQCTEKYLKAFLQERKVSFSKTHDLVELLSLCLPFCSKLEKYRALFDKLTDYAVDFRYPGLSATKSEAQEAVIIMKEARKLMRKEIFIKPGRRGK